MRTREWCLLDPPRDEVEALSGALGVSPVTASILVNRGHRDPEEAHSFLHPSLDQLHDPFLMRGMDRAVEMVEEAIHRNRRILVFGDYDVDGVTGTTLLVRFIRRHGGRADYHIPHRVEEGYGLQREVIRRFAAAGGGLVITVDCGISGVTEITEGRALGVDFVVTDHHEPHQHLPPAGAIINPRQFDCRYPFKDLAGVGIAFKFVQGLAMRLGPEESGMDGTHGAGLASYLDLVALGTVADIVPLVGENRALVAAGLDVLTRTANPGLHALKMAAGLDSRPLGPHHIGFTLAPRINAVGRLGRADAAVDLLLEENPARARELAGVLEEENRRRQRIEAEIRREALAELKRRPELAEQAVILLASPDWHPGVVGIVASRLAERHGRPAILIGTGRDPCKGSARSVAGVDIFSTLQECHHLFEAFGGHYYAAGLSIARDNISLLRRELESVAPRPVAGAAATLAVDAVIGFDRLRRPLFDELRLLRPFGSMNPAPVFATENVHITRPPRTVGSNHLRLRLRQKPYEKRAMGFHMGGLINDFSKDLAFHVAYTVDLHGARRGTDPQLRLCDVHFPYLQEDAPGNS